MGFCDEVQCNWNDECTKYNLSSCVNNKCESTPTANDVVGPTASSVAVADAAAASSTTSPKNSLISCTIDESCNNQGFKLCSEGECRMKLCKTDQECQNYNPKTSFCNWTDTCSPIQCIRDYECQKYNKSSCVAFKCVD